MLETYLWRYAYSCKWLGRPSEKFWPKKHFVSILCQWMFHESVLISLGFPAEKHWSWFWVFLVKKKFSLVQFILFPFPFCHRKKNRTLKSYGVFSIINHFLIPFVSQYTVENDREKIPKKIANWTKIIYFEVSHKRYIPFWKSTVLVFFCM